MKMRTAVWVMTVMMLVLGQLWAQNDTSASAPEAQQPENSQQPDTSPAPAFGGNTAQTSNENPPISGLDEPSLEPGASSRSFLILGAHGSESVHSNVTGSATNPGFSAATTGLGSVALQRIWSRFQTSLAFVGGGSYYNQKSTGFHAVDGLHSDTRFLWRTGQFAIRDAFSYLPQGSFGFGSFGGAGAIAGIGGLGGPLSGGSFGGGGIGGTHFFGPGQFASVGQQPRISNVTIADITQAFSPRTTMTVAGSYGLVHFIDNVGGLIDSRQIGAQVGVSHQLSRRDQLGLIYGFQHFRFPSTASGNLSTQLVNVTYGHRLSGRMDFVVAVGPQVTERNIPSLGSDSSVSLSGRASLRYRFPRTSVGLFYNHYNTGGSGFFAGARSDILRITATRPMGRRWTATADAGYTHNSRILPPAAGTTQPANNARIYNYVYAGGSVHRQLNRELSMFVSYQFNQLLFGSGFCPANSSCPRKSHGHTAVVGLDWHLHPIRID